MDWFITILIARLFRLFHGLPVTLTTDDGARDQHGDPPPPSGFVLVADGIGGLDLCGIALRAVLRAERLPYVVQLFRWGHGWGRWHADLTDAVNRDTKAQLVAETIRQFKIVQPSCPVYIVAKSGGSGVAVKALELLGEQTVERVILLAPAMSPGYDLTRALRAVRREMVVFWSPLDVLVLGAGTRLFGTIDRVKSISSGMVGFRVPAIDDADATRNQGYAKLRQVRWRPRMAVTGYLGGHLGPDSPRFLRKYVVPLLRVEESAPC
jgi:alpha-beta hydrolase superfamily lysophospholipase